MGAEQQQFHSQKVSTSYLDTCSGSRTVLVLVLVWSAVRGGRSASRLLDHTNHTCLGLTTDHVLVLAGLSRARTQTRTLAHSHSRVRTPQLGVKYPLL